MPNTIATDPDVVLIGAGIMSATLGVFLKELEPSLNIEMLETLEGPALESSEAWNNAGTGHAANCEMNYTPEQADGSIGVGGQCRVRPVAPALVFSCEERLDQGSSLVHPPGAAHELRAGA